MSADRGAHPRARSECCQRPPRPAPLSDAFTPLVAYGFSVRRTWIRRWNLSYGWSWRVFISASRTAIPIPRPGSLSETGVPTVDDCRLRSPRSMHKRSDPVRSGRFPERVSDGRSGNGWAPRPSGSRTLLALSVTPVTHPSLVVVDRATLVRSIDALTRQPSAARRRRRSVRVRRRERRC